MLEIKGINKTFFKGTANQKELFNNLNITIEAGSFVTIIGSNGAGKSTLLEIISQNLSLDKGEVRLNKSIISNKKAYQVCKQIGRVYQNPNMNVAMNMSVIENISLSLRKNKAYNLGVCVQKKQRPAIALELAAMGMDLELHLDTMVRYLSGGQRQALCLYMTTCTDPQLLLLDEHTAALDPQGSAKIMNLTQTIVTEKKLTTLMVTHNMQHAIDYGDRLLMMHQGEIVVDICGEDKRNLTAQTLIDLFTQIKGSIEDEMVLV